MATPWDRAATSFVEEWVPRFVPYQLDLVRELGAAAGERALVVHAGLGAETLAVARAVGESGHVLATEPAEDLAAMGRAQVEAAGLPQISCRTAPATYAEGGPWDLILCAFGLWQVPRREQVFQAWQKQLARTGKIGILTWGPPEEDDPFERMGRCLAHYEPDFAVPTPRILSERDSMAQMFEEAGLEMVRHTVVRHTMTFKSAESFVAAFRETGGWYPIWQQIGEERFARIAARFYGLAGGPDAPLSWQPAATLVIGAHPGVDVAIPSRRTAPPGLASS